MTRLSFLNNIDWVLVITFLVHFCHSTVGSPGSCDASDKRQRIRIVQVSGPLNLGEGPTWDSERQVLFFVNLFKAEVLKYNPANGQVNSAKVDGPTTSFIIPVYDTTDKFVVGLGKSIAIITWNGISTTVPKEDINILFTVEEDKEFNMFDDGKADPWGRVVAGTASTKALEDKSQSRIANLYSFGKSRILQKILTKVGISNGLAWTGDGQTFYYVDSPRRNIQGFDYDSETGKLSNGRVVFRLDNYNFSKDAVADGMTIDTCDNLWLAVNGEGMVLNIDPRDGSIIYKLLIPTPHVTSVQFIGEHLNQLIVTSGFRAIPAGEVPLIPKPGVTFLVKGLNVNGYEPVKADI